MAALGLAVERQRELGTLPQGSVISARNLHQIFHPVPAGSTRALLLTMSGSGSQKLPWAVILCRFKDSPPDPDLENPIEDFYRVAFTPGSGGLVEYWREVSLGAIDISGSRVFGWVEVEIPRSKAGGTPISMPPGPGREGLIDYAINAVKRLEGEDALKGFLGPIAIYTQNWSKEDVPAGTTWSTPGWFPFWIDGSAHNGRVCFTPPHDGNITAHEMGHIFGMNHDVGSDLDADYEDPCCIMSQNNPFLHPIWQRNFGPAVCLPHLIQCNWMYKRRVYYDDGGWLSQPEGIALPLAPITDPMARANLGIKLAYKQGETTWDYYLEYVRATGWNKGIGKSFLFIRRMAPKYGGTPAILGSVVVPSDLGVKADFLEPSGNVRFQVERLDADGRKVKVGAKKL